MNEHFKNTFCGDCGSPDPQWATLNRGLLLCKDCCCVHRSLGPQCSRVKSLKNSQWSPNLIKMLETLASGCANHVWEHNLLDPSSKSEIQMKKPGPNDLLETVKKPFIHAKHFQFQFVLKQKPETFDERNQELHSTVRTGDLGTTLRLLASGADPNFFHPEKGTRPLHVAARTGQALQVELLFLHGAHTDAPDYLGQTPVEHALAAGYRELAQRIIELRYHLTDTLSYFACSEIPDHSTSKHIIIPNLKYNVSRHEISVRKLPAHVLEQLASDLYDEVDRRHLEKYMLAVTSAADVTKFSIAFLPVDFHFSSVRNQTRQKFARLTEDELASLITLVLMESKRRHCNDSSDLTTDKDIFAHSELHLMNKFNDIGPKSGCSTSQVAASGKFVSQIAEDDDYPLYDCVASDEDLILTEQQTILSQQRSKLEETSLSSSNLKPVSSCDAGQSKENALAAKLMESEAKIQELQDCNQNLKMEIMVLQRMVGSVIHENLDLKSNVSQNLKEVSLPVPISSSNLVNARNGIASHLPELQVIKSRPPRPMSDGPRSPSYSDSHFDKDNALPIRPNTTEVCMQKVQYIGKPIDLVQDATRKIVELIKVLIEYAQSNDLQGVQLTSSKIYIEVQIMASTLLVKETRKDVKDCLENVLLQVLRMKSEVVLLSERNQSNSILRFSNINTSHAFIQKVKQICFEVGAAMKQLVSTTLPSSAQS